MARSSGRWERGNPENLGGGDRHIDKLNAVLPDAMISLQKMTKNCGKRNLATAFAVSLCISVLALVSPAQVRPGVASVISVQSLDRVGGATDLSTLGNPAEFAEPHRGVVSAVQIVVATEDEHDFCTEMLRAVDGWLKDFSEGAAPRYPSATVGIRG